MTQHNHHIKDEPAMRTLLSRMPSSVAKSFTDDQLVHLKVALGARKWGQHKIDCRGTLPLPFVRKNIYYVFLLGKNHRGLSRLEKTVSEYTFSLFTSLLIVFLVIVGVLILYIVKSALGIDLIEGFSFGLWTWINEMWQ